MSSPGPILGETLGWWVGAFVPFRGANRASHQAQNNTPDVDFTTHRDRFHGNIYQSKQTSDADKGASSAPKVPGTKIKNGMYA